MQFGIANIGAATVVVLLQQWAGSRSKLVGGCSVVATSIGLPVGYIGVLTRPLQVGIGGACFKLTIRLQVFHNKLIMAQLGEFNFEVAHMLLHQKWRTAGSLSGSGCTAHLPSRATFHQQ